MAALSGLTVGAILCALLFAGPPCTAESVRAEPDRQMGLKTSAHVRTGSLSRPRMDSGGRRGQGLRTHLHPFDDSGPRDSLSDSMLQSHVGLEETRRQAARRFLHPFGNEQRQSGPSGSRRLQGESHASLGHLLHINSKSELFTQQNASINSHIHNLTSLSDHPEACARRPLSPGVLVLPDQVAPAPVPSC